RTYDYVVSGGTADKGPTGYGYLYDYRPLASIEYPSETMLASDYAADRRDRPGIRPAGDYVYNANDLHNEGSNVAYFDGHAKWVQGVGDMTDPLDVFWSGGK
ncbi:MAG: hypothetical protein R6V07_17635, partial [Armatimonadota bacterium]